jgi:hypothetical protein
MCVLTMAFTLFWRVVLLESGARDCRSGLQPRTEKRRSVAKWYRSQ